MQSPGVVITIKIGDIEMTFDEARAVYEKLHELFRPQVTIPPCNPFTPYKQPYPPYIPPPLPTPPFTPYVVLCTDTGA